MAKKVTLKILKHSGPLPLSRFAEVLGENLRGDITVEDILRFALAGELQLSIVFLNPAFAIPGLLVSKDEAEENYAITTESSLGHREKTNFVPGHMINSNEYFLPDPGKFVEKLRGEFELMLWLNGKYEIERRLYIILGEPPHIDASTQGIYVRKEDSVFEIQSEKDTPPNPNMFSIRNFHPASRLGDLPLVITTHEAERFLSELQKDQRTDKRQRREQILKNYLETSGIDSQNIIPEKMELWSQLNKIDPLAFPPLSKSGVTHFFRSAGCKFRRGYRKKPSSDL